MGSYISSKFASGMLSLPGKMPGERIDLILVAKMREADIAPEVIYAYEKTLLWITETNVRDFIGRPNFSNKEMWAWDAAQDEYLKANPTYERA